MNKNSAGVITFEKIASIINNNAYDKTEVTPRECIKSLVGDLSIYFKKLPNVDFNERQFKKECLK